MSVVHFLLMIEKWGLFEVVLEFPEFSIDALDEHSNTILHYLTLANNVPLLERIFKVSSSTQLLLQKNLLGDEPIHTCIFNDSKECFVAILLKYSRTEAHEELIVTKKNNKGENCFQLAILHQALRIFNYCLGVMKKVDFVDDQQRTPLFDIIDVGNFEFLELYLSRKPNLKSVTTNKENPLFYCLKTNKTAFFKVIKVHPETLFIVRRRLHNEPESRVSDSPAYCLQARQPCCSENSAQIQFQPQRTRFQREVRLRLCRWQHRDPQHSRRQQNINHRSGPANRSYIS